jgi:hypothetical protein
MAPAERRRRRRRRLRPSGRALVAALAALVVLVILLGGVLRSGSQSASYWRAVDLSYAASVRPLVQASNGLDVDLRALLSRMPGDRRTAVQAALDTLVRSSARLAEEASTLATPAPYGGAGGDVSAAMGDRAQALDRLRAAVDGLLGMAPLAVAGSPNPPAAAPRALTPAAAAAALARAGSLLGEADRAYATGRRVLRRGPGRAELAASVWMRRTAALSGGGSEVLASSLASSASLAAVHDVELAKDALVLTPAPVPPGPGAAPTPVIPPTASVAVDAAVANRGNVTERGIVVTARLSGGGGAAAGRRSRPLGLSAGGSLSVPLPAFHVQPDRTYSLTVTVDPPSRDVAGATTSDTFSFHVAPPSPPTVLQVTPTKGKAAGGNDVTILGNGFDWVRGVTFGKLPARFRVVSSTQITAVAPGGTGTVTVTVRNTGGTSATNGSTRYTYRRH